MLLKLYGFELSACCCVSLLRHFPCVPSTLMHVLPVHVQKV